MAEDDLTTPQGGQEEPGKSQNEARGFGPRTEAAINEQLERAAAFAFLGKRAFGDGEDWEKYLSRIGCPFDQERLIEQAFEGLFKVACAAWYEIFEPRDSVKGQLIDRVQLARKNRGEATGEKLMSEEGDRFRASVRSSPAGSTESAPTPTGKPDETVTPEGGSVKGEGQEREYFTNADQARAILNEVILDLSYIRSLGDILNECAGHNVELSTDTLTGIGGQIVDLAMGAIAGLEGVQAMKEKAA